MKKYLFLIILSSFIFCSSFLTNVYATTPNMPIDIPIDIDVITENFEENYDEIIIYENEMDDGGPVLYVPKGFFAVNNNGCIVVSNLNGNEVSTNRTNLSLPYNPDGEYQGSLLNYSYDIPAYTEVKIIGDKVFIVDNSDTYVESSDVNDSVADTNKDVVLESGDTKEETSVDMQNNQKQEVHISSTVILLVSLQSIILLISIIVFILYLKKRKKLKK